MPSSIPRESGALVEVQEARGSLQGEHLDGGRGRLGGGGPFPVAAGGVEVGGGVNSHQALAFSASPVANA
jgi:hypothetical protein